MAKDSGLATNFEADVVENGIEQIAVVKRFENSRVRSDAASVHPGNCGLPGSVNTNPSQFEGGPGFRLFAWWSKNAFMLQ
jgi:hypothetical protein